MNILSELTTTLPLAIVILGWIALAVIGLLFRKRPSPSGEQIGIL